MTANEFAEKVRNYIGKEMFCHTEDYKTVVHGEICGFTMEGEQSKFLFMSDNGIHYLIPVEHIGESPIAYLIRERMM